VKGRFLLASLVLAGTAHAAPTRSSPLAVAPTAGVPGGGIVFAVNPDSNTIARVDFSAATGVLTHEVPVGKYPRTLTLLGTSVYSANQADDSITRCAQADLSGCQATTLGTGCGPYGIAATPAGDRLIVTCQSSSEVLILSPSLDVQARVKTAWPNPRAIAISSDGSKAYVTHFLTEEPGTDGHVSVIDLANKSISAVFLVPADTITCETQNSGQGVLNLLASIAIMPDGAPSDVAGQLWVGGSQQNNISKGLFKRDPRFKNEPGAHMFPLARFTAFPEEGISRNVYRPSFHDIIRLGILKLSAADGTVIGKLDFDEAVNATDIEFSADGTTAYAVDLGFNSYHVLNTVKGQGNDVTTIFAAPSAFGPGGADPSQACVQDALRPIVSEAKFRIQPQAQLDVISGYNPFDASATVVNTGVDFDSQNYWATGTSRMRHVPDGIGTAPIGVRLAPDGLRVYVLNYLARNVVPVAAADPVGADTLPVNLRCTNHPSMSCGRSNDCQAGAGGGFCNHPGGAPCTSDADCGAAGPCIRTQDCVPMILGPPVSTITGRCAGGGTPGAPCKVDGECGGGTCDGIAGDPMPPSILDGKILFNTAARDASVPNGVGLGQGAPMFNEPRRVCANAPGQACRLNSDCAGGPCGNAISVPGEVVSTSHDASYVTCATCHADFGGQDGRTWDFSQFGSSLRNTMDLRGRPGFAPGHCSNDSTQECFFDAACGDGNVCKAQESMIPPNITDPADRARWFNPMLTIHWNGDRDEVEDFEATFRETQGAADCDAAEDLSTCPGALVQRNSVMTSELPRTNKSNANDVEADLGPPNRNLPGTAGHNVGFRLTHLADFVYSLTDFVTNPNQVDETAMRGREIFNDPVTLCGDCHTGPAGSSKQFFTNKRPNEAFDPSQPARGDTNNPFLRFDVGTGNLFDTTDPNAVSNDAQIFQNPRVPIPGSRGPLGDYVTPVLVDVWNTAPYLHDGTAHTLLDVSRPCETTLDDCLELGRGRALHNAGQARHGKTDVLTPTQLNQLVAFEKTLTTSTVLGTRRSVVQAGTMNVGSVNVSFGKVKHGKRRKGRFKITGDFGGAAVPVDPSTGLSLEIATPNGEAMEIVTYTFTLKQHGHRLSGKAAEGPVTLRLKTTSDGRFRFVLIGKKLDLGRLDTGNADLTVAFESGGAQFVRNRNLVAKKGIYRLPKRKG
jgi:hypothetical protein